MKRNQLTIAIGLVGLVAAWYYARRNATLLQGIIAQLPAPPVLPSRQIGSGYIDAIAPLTMDPVTGDVTATHGTDLLLPGLDSSDPSLEYWDGLPGQDPQYDFTEFH